MADISNLYKALDEDKWRQRKPFEEVIEAASEQILAEGKTKAERIPILAKWLTTSQPCLFGRMAAGAHDLLSFCILTEADILEGDSHVRNLIRHYRLEWKRAALLGRKSGFIILATSRRLTLAEPNLQLQNFALKLCTLYLREVVKPDQVHHERIRLEIPAASPEDKPAWYEWRVGVNFFAAAGDGRWWHDHRIPGGIGFSMNSVGHMARSGALQNMATGKDNAPPSKGRLPIDSLAAALRFAMQTITKAEETISGKATCLRPISQDDYNALTPKCPFTASGALALKDYTTYDGWYDTDASVPSDYFRPDVERPASVKKRDLNFTYLFDDSTENPDHETMGQGEQIQ
jgi:hypothetical protein